MRIERSSPTPDPGAGASPPILAPLPEKDPDAAPVLASDCGHLEQLARESADDAVLLVALCPDRPLPPSALRAALLEVGTAAGAAHLAPLLAGQPELWGLAQLAAGGRGPLPLPAALDRPESAVVHPVTGEVLAQVDLAHRLRRDAQAGSADRTRAEAYLARVYFQALLSLGLDERSPLPPFARLLASRALHHGRRFCVAYWQRRVRGLARPFRATEVELRMLSSRLSGTAHHRDDALLAFERQRARQYVLGEGPHARIDRRLEEQGRTSVELPLEDLRAETGRLIDHGFVDLAVDRALASVDEEEGHGLLAIESMLDEALKLRGLWEEGGHLERRLARVRDDLPPEGAVPLPDPRPVPWPAAETVSTRARAWLEAAPADGFGRAHALGRAVLLLTDRPDAVRLLLGSIDDGDSLAAHRAWLLRLIEREEGPSLRVLKLRQDAGLPGTDPDAAVRRRFAARFGSQGLRG